MIVDKSFVNPPPKFLLIKLLHPTLLPLTFTYILIVIRTPYLKFVIVMYQSSNKSQKMKKTSQKQSNLSSPNYVRLCTSKPKYNGYSIIKMRDSQLILEMLCLDRFFKGNVPIFPQNCLHALLACLQVFWWRPTRKLFNAIVDLLQCRCLFNLDCWEFSGTAGLNICCISPLFFQVKDFCMYISAHLREGD